MKKYILSFLLFISVSLCFAGSKLPIEALTFPFGTSYKSLLEKYGDYPFATIKENQIVIKAYLKDDILTFISNGFTFDDTGLINEKTIISINDSSAFSTTSAQFISEEEDTYNLYLYEISVVDLFTVLSYRSYLDPTIQFSYLLYPDKSWLVRQIKLLTE